LARFEVKGTDDLANALESLGGKTGDIARTMISYGAVEMVKSWQDTIKKRGHVLTGQMEKSVKPTKIKDVDGALSVEVYPQGKDDKGVRNAEKAFLAHYGWSSHTGDHFVDEVEEEGGEKAVEAMEKVMDQFIKMKGGN